MSCMIFEWDNEKIIPVNVESSLHINGKMHSNGNMHTNEAVLSLINIDEKLSANLSDEMAQKAMDICPVGAIIHKGKGFDEPIGTRKYDKVPIGSDIESVV